MTTKQHRIVTLNGNEYIKFDLQPYGYDGMFAIGTEDDVFHQGGYAAIKDGEVWRLGEFLANEADLEDTGRTWSEPDDLLAIWAANGLPTKNRMTVEEEMQAILAELDEVFGVKDLQSDADQV